MDSDVIIVGSGPAGANAAKRAIEEGLSVTLIDFGVDEPELAESIPPQSFSALRRSDPNQRRYFLGEAFESEWVRNDRTGAHFTAPRAYITKHVEELLPFESETFFPVQSLALGGLAVGWGAGCYTYERFELQRAGMPAADMSTYYDDVVRDIGVSGASTDDTSPYVMATKFAQPPSEIDTNAKSILELYNRRRSELHLMGFHLGRDPIAMLTKAVSKPGIERHPNLYTDMDFYGTSDYSVYRPKYTIMELQQHSMFCYHPGALVDRFEEKDEGVVISYLDYRSKEARTIAAKKLLLAAGPINSARIVARSRGMFGVELPIISNHMHYMPCVNLRMLGRPVNERRHSLGQLIAVFAPLHRESERVVAGLICYRSLLHHRIIREMPLPPSLGLIVSRILISSLIIVSINHPETRSRTKWIRLEKRAIGDTLVANYEWDQRDRSAMAADVRGVIRCLWKLRCVPLAVFSTPAGTSIHYAGTIPVAAAEQEWPFTSDFRGKLRGSRHVFLADSSTWNYLPAKAPTLTIMANARRVAHEAAVELRTGRI
jgi:choline dehydrogenase-like flavoprotein